MGSEHAKEGTPYQGTREGRQAVLAAAAAAADPASPTEPKLAKQSSIALVEQIKKQAKQARLTRAPSLSWPPWPHAPRPSAPWPHAPWSLRTTPLRTVCGPAYRVWPSTPCVALPPCQVRKRFLVATLNTARWRDPSLPAADPEVLPRYPPCCRPGGVP